LEFNGIEVFHYSKTPQPYTLLLLLNPLSPQKPRKRFFFVKFPLLFLETQHHKWQRPQRLDARRHRLHASHSHLNNLHANWILYHRGACITFPSPRCIQQQANVPRALASGTRYTADLLCHLVALDWLLSFHITTNDYLLDGHHRVWRIHVV
jgi:hypothetical protein